MKPTRRPHMTASRLALVPLLASLALAGCIPAPERTPVPPHSPARMPMPAPTQAPVTPPPPPFSGNWMDAPVTPGDWSYAAGVARFGETASEPRLTMRCDRAARMIEISRSGTAVAALQMVIRTETVERSVDAVPAPGAQPAIVARIRAHDPLLDAMAFSRGRFAIEIGGLPALYVPSWPEVTRVIEDCR
jgi:hypothetical protein